MTKKLPKNRFSPMPMKTIIRRDDYVFIGNTYDHRSAMALLDLIGGDNLSYDPESKPSFAQIRVYREGVCICMTGLAHCVIRLAGGEHLSLSLHAFEKLFEVMS